MLYKDLINRVQKFITSHDKPGNLSIILFTGYSVVGPLDAWISTPQLFLGGAVDTDNRLIQPTFNWTRNSNMLDCYEGGEVLVLLDCPCLFVQGSNHAEAELLAAGVWDNDNNAKDASTYGLTEAINGVLRRAEGASISAADLYAEILEEAASDMFAGKAKALPIHLINSKQHRSVVLRRCDRQEESKAILSEVPRVVLSVYLENDGEMNHQDWISWLKDFSSDSTLDIEIIAAHYASSSTIVLLFSIPSRIWTCLNTEILAFRFVSHVQERDILRDISTLPEDG